MSGLMLLRSSRLLLWLGVIAVGILAFWVRIVDLSLSPPALNWDEVSHGYNAYAIIKTGRDEWGLSWPMIFRAFGDYKLPVYIYATVPGIALFGLHEWTVRLPSVLSGVLSTLATFALIRELGLIAKHAQKESLSAPWNRIFTWEVWGLVSAFLVAISPWTWFLSRIAVEANMAVALIISGTALFLLGIRQIYEHTVKAWAFFPAGFLLGLSLFTYNSARVFTPLLLALLVWIFAKELELERWIPEKLRIRKDVVAPRLNCSCHLVGIGLFLCFLLAMLLQATSPGAQARFNEISVLDQGAINQIEQARNQSELPTFLTKLMYNRPTYVVKTSVLNLFSYLDFQFWFLKGGGNNQFNLPDFGLLYLVTAPLLILGILLVPSLPPEVRWLLIGWILLAPIPALPTRDNPHTLRIVTLIPIPFLLTGLGAVGLIYWLGAKLGSMRVAAAAMLLFAISLGVSIKYYWEEYRFSYPINYFSVWQYGNKQMVEFVKSQYDNVDTFFITKRYGEVHEFILFYWPWDPADFVNKKQWDYHANWYWINAFDKFTFFNDWEVQQSVGRPIANGKRILLITSPDNAPEGWKLIKVIRGLDGSPIYSIYENT